MNYNFIPRFYYSVRFQNYFITGCKYSSVKLFSIKQNSNSTLYNTNTARTGLRLLLDSIGPESLKIGIQAYTCETVFLAIKKAGHRAVFIDLTTELTMDKEDLKRKTDEIDVLIVTHTFGYPDDIDEIKKIVGNKIIIEDCAHSYLSKYNGQFTGLMGDAAIFSTGLAKFPPIGSGGFCIINDKTKFPLFEKEYSKLAKRGCFSSLKVFLKMLILSIIMKRPYYGLITFRIGKKLDKKLDLTNKYNFPQYRGSRWVTRVFRSGQPYFIKLLKKQKENAALLNSLVENKTLILNPKEYSDPNALIFPLFVENRDELYNIFMENSIESGKHFSRSLEWAATAGYNKGECKNTEDIVKHILTVPCHYGVSKKSIRKIAKIINEHAKAPGKFST